MNIKNVTRTIATFIALLICLSLFPSINIKAETNSNLFTYSDYIIEYNVVNEWEGHQNIEIKLTNTGSEPIYNWAFGYNAGGEIINIWNSTIYSNSGTNYVIKNSGYNYEVMPNESITFGYTLMGNNLTIPSSFENCAERIEISDEYNVQMIITDKWDVGFTGYIEITNVADVPLEAWMLSFDTNFTIDNFWNANIVENDEYSYIASSKIMSNPIQPQDSVQIGISASIENGTEPIITNVVMSAVQIKNSISSDKNNDGNIIDDSDDLVGKMYFKDLSSEDDLIYDLDGNCYFKNQVLLTAYDGVSFETVSSLADSVNARIVGYIELTNDYQIEFNYDMSIDELFGMVSELSVNSTVEFVTPNIVFESVCDSLPNDKEIQPKNYVKIHEENWHLYAINAIDAWDYYTNSNLGVSTNTVKIGVIDDSFYTEHDDLDFVKTWNNPSCVDLKNAHGTLVAGIIGADFNNTEGVAGVCPKTELYGYALNGGVIELPSNSHIMQVKYALALMIGNNVRVINISMAPKEDLELGTKSVESFLSKLLNKGYDFVIVCSAGNDKTDAKKNSYFSNIDKSSPVYSHIIVVGAVVHQSDYERDPITNRPLTSEKISKKDKNGNLTLEFEYRDDSNYGNRVDVVAIGASVLSTDKENRVYKKIEQTSAAAPQVAGVAGMIYSIKPDLKGDEVKSIIINSAKESANNDSKRLIKCDKGQGYDYALIDAKAAVDMALNKYGPFIPTFEKDKAIVFGTVTDENDKPVGHAKIVVTSKNSSYKIDDETDDYGNYVLTLPLGTYDIEFYTGDKPVWNNLFLGKDYKYFLTQDKVIELDVDSTIQAYPLDVKLDKIATNSIKVMDSNGNDLSDYTVMLTNLSNHETYMSTINSSNFLYGNFDDDYYTISFSKSGYISKAFQIHTNDGLIYDESENLLEEISLTPIEIILKGTVEEYNRSTGETIPIANHKVELYFEDQPDLIIETGITDINGKYEIKIDKHGDFIVKFSEDKQVAISTFNGEYTVDMVFEKVENIDVVFALYSNNTYLKYMKSEIVTSIDEILKEAEKQNVSVRIHFVLWTGGLYTNANTGLNYADNVDDAAQMINRTLAIDTNLTMPNEYPLTNVVVGIRDRVKDNLQENSKKYCFIVDAGCTPRCSSTHTGIKNLQKQEYDFSFIYSPENSNAANYSSLSSNNSCYQFDLDRIMFSDFVVKHVFC